MQYWLCSPFFSVDLNLRIWITLFSQMGFLLIFVVVVVTDVLIINAQFSFTEKKFFFFKLCLCVLLGWHSFSAVDRMCSITFWFCQHLVGGRRSCTTSYSYPFRCNAFVVFPMIFHLCWLIFSGLCWNCLYLFSLGFMERFKLVGLYWTSNVEKHSHCLFKYFCFSYF